jgi:hypothetical protein
MVRLVRVAVAARAQLPQSAAAHQHPLTVDPFRDAAKDAPHDEAGKQGADSRQRDPALPGGDFHQFIETLRGSQLVER